VARPFFERLSRDPLQGSHEKTVANDGTSAYTKAIASKPYEEVNTTVRT